MTKLIDTKTLADFMGVNEDTVRRYCRSGKIPCVKFGNEYRVKEEDYESFVASRIYKPKVNRAEWLRRSKDA